jgi:enamine deaminase RidA (YjgF/YER057c/UK114 family)
MEYKVPSRIEVRLKELNIELPTPTVPAANYLPHKKVGPFVYIAGQVPTANGKDQYVGKLGGNVTLEQGQAAARLCALNIVAQLKNALDGNLDRVMGCVRLGGFVNTTSDFGDHPKVINGASDLMVEIFGDAGRHSRTAVGCVSLPRNVAVEVDAIFEVA